MLRPRYAFKVNISDTVIVKMIRNKMEEFKKDDEKFKYVEFLDRVSEHMIHDLESRNKIKTFKSCNDLISIKSENFKSTVIVNEKNFKFNFYSDDGFLKFFENITTSIPFDNFLEIYFKEIQEEVKILKSKESSISKIDEIDSDEECVDMETMDKLSEMKFKKNVLEVTKHECYQYSLLIAYYLEFDKTKIEDIINYYIQAHTHKRREFPYYRFKLFSDKVDLETFKKITNWPDKVIIY